MAMAPSSPRLPSPPPPAEIQITPNSPSGGPAATLQATEMEQSLIDAHSKRRIHPGTKSADMATGPPLVPLSELESAFSLQEHLAALHYHHTGQGTRPVNRNTALQLAQPPNGVDRTLWLYELCRFLISQCNSLIVGFLFDTPPCSANTCPEMRASEWQFLCAVHEQPKSCCAIDYCCHTLDWAANVVSDQKIFPSRFVILNDAHSKNVGVKNLVNVFRRLHRIFAHAWFQHRSVFWAVEAERGLYVFFKTVCDLYDLLPAENYKLPPEAEGLEAPPTESDTEKPVPTILKSSSSQQQNLSANEDNLHPGGRTNTRRHIRSSPSTGSAVTTVIEAEEEEPTEAVTRGMGNMHLSASDSGKAVGVPELVEESPSGAVPAVEVPQTNTSLAEDPEDVADTTVVESTEINPPTDSSPESASQSTESTDAPVAAVEVSKEGTDSSDAHEGPGSVVDAAASSKEEVTEDATTDAASSKTESAEEQSEKSENQESTYEKATKE